MKNPYFRGAILAAGASLVLAACGGGGGDDYDLATAATPPDSASQSSQGFLEFIDGMSRQMFDGREPFDLSAFNAPTDDADSKPPVTLSIDG